MDDANDEVTTTEVSTASLLSDLRTLARQDVPDSCQKLKTGTDRLIIAAMRRVEGTPGARLAAAEAARACRTLAEDLHESEHLHNDATVEALAEARDAAVEAIDRLEVQLAACPPPADPGKQRRRSFARPSSVVMKKRRPMSAPPPKAAAGGD